MTQASEAAGAKRDFGPAVAGEPLMRLEKVERVYRLGSQEVHALKGIDLEIAQGSFVALMGRSGSGKTTLLNVMGGLDRPTSGRVLYNGRDLTTFSERELTRWRRQEIGLIFQAYALLPALTAVENVELPLRIVGTRPREAAARSRECLEMVGLAKRMNHRSFELSGGEQQRVAIARALVTRPRLILADEPTGELDQATAAKVLELFRDIVDSQGVTIYMVTHDPVAASYADVTYTMDDGRIVAQTGKEGAKDG